MIATKVKIGIACINRIDANKNDEAGDEKDYG